jgi:hypothetical protein
MNIELVCGYCPEIKCCKCGKSHEDTHATICFVGDKKTPICGECMEKLIVPKADEGKKIQKITNGYVIQTFDSVSRKCTNQEFVAGDPVEFEDEFGTVIDTDEEEVEDLYCPFEMKQPEQLEKEGWNLSPQ